MSLPPVRRRSASPRALAVSLVGVLVAALLSMVAPAAAQAAELPSSIMEGGFIISDAEYFDSDSMTAAQIQTFLNARVPTCKATTGPTCLKSFKTALPKKAADRYCKEVAARTTATAAEVIAAVSLACGINPKVILVMLQKEQGLVTATAPTDWSYRAAMGQSCPDTAPCDAAAAGFVNQVYLGARQQQVYTMNPTSFNYRAGQVNTIKWSPTSSCGTSKVYIQNQATANLYIYTPYRPNVAALAAGYGTGDSCSTYGNRNFYNYYVDWFAPSASASTGAPAQVAACTVPVAADIAAATGTATAKAAVTVRTAPITLCGTGSTALAKGAKLTVTGAYGSWIRGTTGGKTYWAPTASFDVSIPTPAASGDVCALPSAASIAAASGTVMVTTSTLNARKAPSTTCETGKTQLTMGQTATRTGTYGEWWRITVNGAAYWVHSAYVEVQKPTATPITPVTRYTSLVHLRSEPASSGAVLHTFVRGDEVTAVAQSGDWTEVTQGSLRGWVETGLLFATKPSAAATSTLQTTAAVTLRSAAIASGPVVTSLPKGTKVTVIGSTGTWRAVTSGTARGWVEAQYLAEIPVAKPITPVTRYTSIVHLRSEPVSNGGVLYTFVRGDQVTAVAHAGTWTEVTQGSLRGWVETALLFATKPSAAATSALQTSGSVTLRSSATESGTAVTTLPMGTKVTVIGSTGTWRAVTSGPARGWVEAQHLTDIPAAAPIPAVTRYTSIVHLRSEPVSNGGVLYTFVRGDEVTAVAEAGGWTEVTQGSLRGWVETGLLFAAKPSASATSTLQTSTAVTLRSSATESGSVVTTLPNATKVTVIGSTGTWRAVTSGTTRGWVEAQYLTAVPVATRYTSVVHLRAQPAGDGAVLHTFVRGDQVTAVGQSGAWTEVTQGSLRGWVETSLLFSTKPSVPAASTLQTSAAVTLRSAATATGPVVTTLAKGTKVTVIGSTGTWRAVTVGTRRGWVEVKYLGAVSAATTVKTTTASLNLRASASTTAKIITVLPKGTKVTVVGSSGTWRKVTVGSRTGWVSASYLK